MENVVSDVPVDPRTFESNAPVAKMEQQLLMIRRLFPDLRTQVLTNIVTADKPDNKRESSDSIQNMLSPAAQEGNRTVKTARDVNSSEKLDSSDDKPWNYGLLEDSPNKDTQEGRWNSLGQQSSKLAETLNEARQRIASLREGIAPSEKAANQKADKGEPSNQAPEQRERDLAQEKTTPVTASSLVPEAQGEPTPPRTQAKTEQAQPQRAAPPLPVPEGAGGQAVPFLVLTGAVPIAWREPAEWTKEEVAKAEAERSQAEHPEFARISKILPMTYLQLSLPMLPYKQIMAQVQPRVLSSRGRAGVYNVYLADPNAPLPNANGPTTATAGPNANQTQTQNHNQPAPPLAQPPASASASAARSPAMGANPGGKVPPLATQQVATGVVRPVPGHVGQGPHQGGNMRAGQPKMQLVNLLNNAKSSVPMGKNQVVGKPPHSNVRSSPPTPRTQAPGNSSLPRRPASAAASPSHMVRATPPPGALFSPPTRVTSLSASASSSTDRRYAPAYSLTSPNPPPSGYVIRRPSPGPNQSHGVSSAQHNTGKVINARPASAGSNSGSAPPDGAYQVQRGGFPAYGGGQWGGFGQPQAQRSPMVNMQGGAPAYKSPALQGGAPANRGSTRIPT